jgi:ankyrin repeat protein
MIRSMGSESQEDDVTRSETTWGRRTALRAAGIAALAAFAPGAALAQGFGADVERAIRVDNANALRAALRRGADPNGRDEAGEPLVVAAAKAQAWGCVRALAETDGVDLDAVNKEGVSALMFASLHGELELARLLVSRKAAVNKAGWTPLHYAAVNGHLDVVRFLVERGARIDAASPNGTTPLMMAARHQQVSAAELLLELGADPTPRNEAGFDAAAYARGNGSTRLADRLAERAKSLAGGPTGAPPSR